MIIEKNGLHITLDSTLLIQFFRLVLLHRHARTGTSTSRNLGSCPRLLKKVLRRWPKRMAIQMKISWRLPTSLISFNFDIYANLYIFPGQDLTPILNNRISLYVFIRPKKFWRKQVLRGLMKSVVRILLLFPVIWPPKRNPQASVPVQAVVVTVLVGEAQVEEGEGEGEGVGPKTYPYQSQNLFPRKSESQRIRIRTKDPWWRSQLQRNQKNLRLRTPNIL